MAAGVTRMITMGVDLDRSRRAVALAHQHDQVWAGVGLHPNEAADATDEELADLASDPQVVVVGEIGLDFVDEHRLPRDLQLERFDRMLSLAASSGLPVSIHNRGAEEAVLAAISRYPGLRGVMHYFALEWDWAERFLDAGLHLSFAGLVTRPSRHALREVVKRCPAERLLLETDSPYGNAHGRMGVPNRPAYLLDTAELVAELRAVSLAELGDAERAGALALFTRMR